MERIDLLRARIAQAAADADLISATLLAGVNSTIAESTADAEFWLRSLEGHLASARTSLGYVERELRKPAKEAV